MDLYNLLEKLTDADGVSGDENDICALITDEFPECKTTITDGNLVVFLSEIDPAKKTVLIDAHIDRIGFIVTQITENGFLRVGNIGKTDMRILPASRVYVGKNRYPGIICTKPPHLSDKDTKPFSVSDILIDVGMKKADTEKIISPGDRILLHEKFSKLEGDVVAASALDNRAGAAAVIAAGKKILETTHEYNVVLLFSSCEEVTERGAIISSFNINPDIALVVDVTFAKTHGENSNCGETKGGVMIGVSASLDKDLSKELITIAKKKNIPYQIEVMSSRTGTNADVIAVSRGGVKASTLSIPIKFMHTQSETVSIFDIEKTVDLIVEFVRS
ncbi:MAG: M42 family peptidase [Ruminococcus sp.]|jgi:endoglucanase|nr:M42 family peptidase [Ruminococcus sp.]